MSSLISSEKKNKQKKTGGGVGGGRVARRCRVSYITVQLILTYSWARPAIPVTGKVEGECCYFFCFSTFIPVPLSSLSLSFIASTTSSLFFLSLGDDTK